MATKGAIAALPLLALVLTLAGCGDKAADKAKAEAEVTAKAEAASPYPLKPLWGDTHLHTANSSDAFALGARLGPEDALRFARGEAVTSSTGIKAQLERPLDFLVVSDHSDGLGAIKAIYDAPRLMLRDPTLRRWHDMMHEGPAGMQKAAGELITGFANKTLPASMMDPSKNAERTKTIWTDQNAIVERYNEPGKFTSFFGFEYTLMPDGNNLHRIVIMRDGKAQADKVVPFSSTVGTSVDQLWDYMDTYEKTTGGQILAIPHNSNVSNGLMFQLTQTDGKPMTAAYAARRAAHEPVVEITQIKGDSETHPFLSPNDEFAGFGQAGWELGNLSMTQLSTPSMYTGNYVRAALQHGLEIEAKTGVNPYKFGVIGSTDSHTALSTADENNFFGKHAGVEPSATRAMLPQSLGKAGRVGWQYLAGGYAAVWAKANTRAEIFDAMKRREVYASTGPRMTVRLFGGWDFAPADLQGDWVKAGYARGVPMGGDLKPAGKAGAPTFIVSALKDPIGANLDRVQIVKGWIDAKGATHEQVYDVVWSTPATRKPGANGKLPPVGDTVDLKTATYTNSIGAPTLQTVWTDPAFDPAQKAFYYVRVLEIPTPRWVAYDIVRYKAKVGPEVQLKSQERAYSAPIWYDPKA
ncbi:DUF3604 domain-containing protein [Polymorphobacter arshaanensis]|uniref:DUF3604 domain-containing protein n=1 Tax=Glacieibacterium arshaanense TaxID=2511025 RepID=A0A4Y9EP15_9SPHN|nr:DUF3604 domain-containing protein [Polymorphobacter arshaanensis]TFU03511.1 DUF3604 domain-containing protein [Polymorphobacter arshaanensis]